MPGGLPALEEFTLETWVRPESFGSAGSYRAIMNYDGWASGYLHFQFYGTQLEFSINGNSPADQYLTNFTFSANTWDHVAVAYSKSAKTLKWYVNGVSQQTNTYSTAVALTPWIPLKLGSWKGTERFFDGQMDEFHVWNVVRSQAQIQASMLQPLTGTEPGLVAYYRFDEGTGTTA